MEEIVDELPQVPGAIVLPSWVVERGVSRSQRSASQLCHGLLRSGTTRSAKNVRTLISKDHDAFTSWIDKHVMGRANFSEYCESVGI